MNKSEMLARVAARTGLDGAGASAALDALLETVAEALARGEEVRLAGFGTFTVRSRAARSGRHPRTGETVSIPASRVAVFKPAAGLRALVDTDLGPG